MTKALGFVLAASAAFAIIGGIDSCNQRQAAKDAEEKLAQADTTLQAQREAIRGALEKSYALEQENKILFEEKDYLLDSLGDAQSAIEKLERKRKQDRANLAQLTNASDSNQVLLQDVSNLEGIVEQKDKFIRSMKSTETKSLLIIANLTVDRNQLRDSLTKVDQYAQSLQNLNSGLRKDLSKLSREPLVDFDVGIGFSTLPLNNWETGPSINATVSLHP